MKPFVCSSLIILTAFVSVSSATNTVDTSKTWKLLQKRAAQSQKSQEPQLVGLAVDSKNTESNKTGGAKSTDTSPRQYGHYHSSGYGGGSGSYDIYTLLAVSAFAALFGALFFQLATGSTFRSMKGGSSFQFNPMDIFFDTDQLPQLISTISDWITKSEWLDTVTAGAKSRALREVGGDVGIKKWIQAYQKDPVEYQCIRKIACQTLARSSVVKNSMKTEYGTTFLNVMGRFIDHGEELQGIVKEVAGNPDRCVNYAPWGLCDDGDDES